MTTSTRTGPEIVVVTGASTGIGAATTRRLAAQGYHVLAGVRHASDAEQLRSERIEPRILGITVEADVAAIADRVAYDPITGHCERWSTTPASLSTPPSKLCRWVNGGGSSRSTSSVT